MSIKSLFHAAVIAGLLSTPQAAMADQMQDDAQAAADRWDQAYNAGEVDKLSNLYASDAIVVTKGKTQSGEDIGKFFSGLKSKGWDDHKTVVKSAQPKGDLVIVTGRWEMTGPGPDGAKKKFEGNWVNVLEKKDGSLKTVLHTWN
ncbi:DUF4440 domain-containing protein [Methylobacterium sp. Leaf108]|uniref:YybH family protein n=1 Tax=Methylobacterium sp. Leaf108 TaxID=1736256 RepID=UPI0009E922CC|nr:DUF4440 domain-containing protein [Methylobacterium sp. Leaf108]